MPEFDNGLLLFALQHSCSNNNLAPLERFLDKCIQLHDTIKVRHGIMLVGQAFSGKSALLHTLQDALCSLKGEEGF